MAYVAAHAAVALPRPRPRITYLTLSIALSIAVLLTSAFVVGRLIGAVASEPSRPAAQPVHLATTGHLNASTITAGESQVSAITVTNNGIAPIRWAAYPTSTGTPAVVEALTMSVATAAGGSCSSTDSAVRLRTPSPAPLDPGESVTVCVTMSLPSSAASTPGTVTPGISITGTPA